MKHPLLLASLCLAAAQPLAAQNTRLDPTFNRPVILNGTGTGTVNDVVQQPDGKYLIGGSFTSINGVRARNLARLNADGTLDVAFTANSSASGQVNSLALQADGNILVGGRFDSLAAAPRRLVGRLLPTGLLDTGFDANLPAGGAISQVALLPGGDLLALESRSVQMNGGPVGGLYRLGGQTGQLDASFQQAVLISCLAVQADGKIVTGGSGLQYNLVHKLARLLPTGQLDPSFAAQTATGVYTSRVLATAAGIYHLAYSPNGYTYSGLQTPAFRTNDWGTLLATEVAPLSNGLVLVGGTNAAGAALSSRLLPTGHNDGSYLATNGPVADANRQGRIVRLLVQPNGALMMAGSFTLAGTTPVHGLVRMLDDNLLSAKDETVEATTVWPVPASKTLHVGLAAAARPQQVQLLDGLGRVVLTHTPDMARPDLALDVAALPAGLYLLRVQYARHEPVQRRVVVEYL